METMRPSGPVKLESIESGIYKEVGIYAWGDYFDNIMELFFAGRI